MELVVKGIKLKAAANLPFKYKAHFRRDFFNDILRLARRDSFGSGTVYKCQA